MSAVFTIVFALFAASAPPASYVCTDGPEGGSCYGALGGPRSARFQSYSWGGEVFLATYAGHNFHCVADGGGTATQLFAQAASSIETLVVTWDQYHRCTSIDVAR